MQASEREHHAARGADEPRGFRGFPARWIDGTRAEPAIETWACGADTWMLRQSLRTSFEAPFLVLLVGTKRAFLMDSGTGDVDVRSAVDAVLEGRDVDLVVGHSHAHSDHVGGDAQFVGRPRTTIVGHDLRAVENAFALRDGHGTFDLGDRPIDVLAIPGHEATHVAFFDRATRVLLSGDSLYPGRLTVRDWPAYRGSVERLVRFVDAHPPLHVVGAHVELDADNREYAPEATEHPNEHRLELTEAHLRDLHRTLDGLPAPARTTRPDFVVVPVL